MSAYKISRFIVRSALFMFLMCGFGGLGQAIEDAGWYWVGAFFKGLGLILAFGYLALLMSEAGAFDE